MSEGKETNFWSSSSIKIYSSHALSSWGDRMWSFAVGLYLVMIFPESLQLTAIYGFLSAISGIFLGAVIGKWVDKTERLKAAQVSLIVQNSSVIICAILLIIFLGYPNQMKSIWNGALGVTMISFVIVFGIISNLASTASKLVLEKDWIVVLSGGNEHLLSKMNSTMRTINLTTFILAPILVGQIFTFGSHIIGALFIGSWNIVSGIVEYYLLIIIYKSIPQLSQKFTPLEEKSESESEASEDSLLVANKSQSQGLPSNYGSFEGFPPGMHPESEAEGWFRKYWKSFQTKLKETRNGWRDYFLHPIRNAGLGLAFLYMTVLGFDQITTGYAYSQGVSESLLGIMTAFGAIFGILGSLSFPFLRKKFGKLVTGNVGFGAETFCCAICLVSILAPGSPFIALESVSFGFSDFDNDCNRNFTTDTNGKGSQSTSEPIIAELVRCNISVVLLLIGIITARFGLWIADLSVLQIFQERISENQRGVLNGVQGALNQAMDLLKFFIVIILPKSDTFAYLIIASWFFVFFGWLFFISYTWENRQIFNTNEMKYSNAQKMSSRQLE